MVTTRTSWTLGSGEFEKVDFMRTGLLGIRLRQEGRNVLGTSQLAVLLWECKRSHAYMNYGPVCVNFMTYGEGMVHIGSHQQVKRM